MNDIQFVLEKVVYGVAGFSLLGLLHLLFSRGYPRSAQFLVLLDYVAGFITAVALLACASMLGISAASLDYLIPSVFGMLIYLLTTPMWYSFEEVKYGSFEHPHILDNRKLDLYIRLVSLCTSKYVNDPYTPIYVLVGNQKWEISKFEIVNGPLLPDFKSAQLAQLQKGRVYRLEVAGYLFGVKVV